MKLQTTFLVGGLMLVQCITLPLYATMQNEKMSVLSVCEKKYEIDIRTKYERHRKRGTLPVITGYIEDNVLFLSLNLPLTNVQMRVVDGETGQTVFEGLVSGTSLSIALERDSESFDVYFK